MTDNAILAAALAFHDAGACVLPAAADGTKRPAVPWKEYQQARPTREQLAKWFDGSPFACGLGVVCGAISGNLEMLELEGRAIEEGLTGQLSQLVQASGLTELWGRLASGYLEFTPSGGLHLLYRVDGTEVARNTKLARRPATDAELAANPAEKIKVLIETRGEGGWVVVAPSAGTTHPTGQPWALAAGGPSTIPTITAAERDALHRLAAAFDRLPVTGAPAPGASTLFTQPARAHDDDSVSPGDDYNARAGWEEILVPAGWMPLWRNGSETYWRRPGKTTGISASTGRNEGDNLYVWTTSTEFEAERPYDKFGAYAVLNHGGTTPAALSAAARALQAAGYGHRPPPTIPAPVVQPPPLVVDGNLATVHHLHPAPALQVVEERSLAHSDDGSALDLAARYGDVIRYCPERGRWLAWDGTVWEWQPQGGGVVREYAKQAARALPDADKAAVSWKKKALSAQGTTATLTQASTDVRLVVSFDDLDAHPMELNTPAGIVDLFTGTVGSSDAAKLHTKVTACAPDFQADTTRWATFLADTFGDDPQLIGYLQRLVGYSATGSVAEHVLPFAVGSGGNGKGVFLESLMTVLGDYATTAPNGFLMAKNTVQHETEIARLAGMRMVICSEVDEDARFDETKVKQLTGGDSLTARFMRQDHFTFTASHHLWLMGNHQPRVASGGGRAFWRRLRLIPFTREVPEDKMVPDLQGILARDHGPVLLAWIIAGAAAYATGGLAEPESVKVATSEYASDQDTVSRFVAECCHLAAAEQVQIKKTALREAYERWCFTEGETPVSAKKLTQELARRHGIGETRTGAARFYTGVTILADEPSEPVTEPAEHPGFTDASQGDSGKIGGPGW